MLVRGIEHIGITVTDLNEAERFFTAALGASVLYRIIPPDNSDKAIDGAQMHPANGFPPEMQVTGLAMLRLANGCNIELFQTAPPVDNTDATPAKAGLNHFSVYVEDIAAAGRLMQEYGARMFDGPSDCFAQETGRGNQTWFGLTPFGVLIELITLPSPLEYDEGATATRWLPAAGTE